MGLDVSLTPLGIVICGAQLSASYFIFLPHIFFPEPPYLAPPPVPHTSPLDCVGCLLPVCAGRSQAACAGCLRRPHLHVVPPAAVSRIAFFLRFRTKDREAEVVDGHWVQGIEARWCRTAEISPPAVNCSASFRYAWLRRRRRLQLLWLAAPASASPRANGEENAACGGKVGSLRPSNFWNGKNQHLRRIFSFGSTQPM